MFFMRLAPYAMRDEKGEGRRFPEAAHPYRTPYQRDRDRIIHTKAFRRLEKKTQVFSSGYSDHFRNRLTHTIEVSQISRTVSKALGLNTDLCEVLALSHDLGHPPFSHEGEKILDRLMRECGSGFEHNLHGLRIVEDFEEKYPGFRGLNLTFEVREGIVKHSRDYAPGQPSYVDLSLYRPGERPPLEAQLIDLTDEIAYNTADLDDGYDSELLSVSTLRQNVAIFDLHYREVEKVYSGTPEKIKVSETIRRTINQLVTSLIDETRCRLDRAGIDSVEKVRSFPRRLFEFEPSVREMNLELKQFLQQNLYNHGVLRSGRRNAQQQIEDLFRYYVRHPESLPQSHVERIAELGTERVVCDYIAGMTDPFAQSKHEEIRSAAG